MGKKKTYNYCRSSLQFKTKNKYFINTINTDYIKQGSKSKMSLMSPTSYQTAPTRDISGCFFVTSTGAVWTQTFLSSNVTFSHLLVGRVTRDISGCFFVTSTGAVWTQTFLSSNVTFSHLLVGRVTRANRLYIHYAP